MHILVFHKVLVNANKQVFHFADTQSEIVLLMALVRMALAVSDTSLSTKRGGLFSLVETIHQGDAIIT